MPRQKREKSVTGICLVMQGKESKTCPCDFSNRSENRPLIYKIAIFLSIRAHLAEKMNKLASIYVILAFLSIEFGVFCLILRS